LANDLIAKTIVGKHDQGSKYLVPTNTGTKIGRTKKYGCANVEFGGNGKTRSIAIVSNKYNEEDRKRSKTMTEKLLRKVHKQRFVGIRKQYLLDKKNHSRNFPSSRNRSQQKAKKIMTLDTLNFQLQNLQYLQKNLSDKSEVYVAYSKNK
jgi:hypothetical protein